MDLQPVFNYYIAVSYMSASSSKSKLETLQTLLQAYIEIRSMKQNVREPSINRQVLIQVQEKLLFNN